MLPSLHRLRSSDVERVLKAGISLSGEGVRAKASPRERAETSRFAVVVSKKLAGNAVVRNRMRREVFSLIPSLTMPSVAHDVVLMVGRKYESKNALAADLTKVLARLVR